MMNEKHMLKSYWAEAANIIVYLMNRCTTSGVHEVTPHEKYFGKKPNLSHTHIFGAIAYKSEKCILVGYSLEQKGYKCYNQATRKV